MEEIFDSDGFLTDGSGMKESDLVTAGGSLEHYMNFVKVAKEGARVVESVEKRLSDIRNYMIANGERKASEVTATKAKLSKLAAIDESEKKELEDEHGSEEKFKKSCVGIARVPLANIKISPDMENLISPNRVKFIVSSIQKKYDPTLSFFVITPEEDHRSVDLKNVRQVGFFAVQKLHTLAALKELENNGEFSKLISHEDKTVLCYIVKTSEQPGMLQCGNQRSNEISSQFCRKTKPQDLSR